MPPPVLRRLGTLDYARTFAAMQAFTDARDDTTPDELWSLQHPPVFTQGQAGRPEHLLMPGDIPVVASDRGGQVTYHGPGQLVVYVMVSLPRLGLGVRALVTAIESALIDLLAAYRIEGRADPLAPGVYVDGAKIASLGLRVRRGCSYHGLSLNVDMDLEPYSRINPCGRAGQAVTQLRALGVAEALDTVSARLQPLLLRRLGYPESLQPRLSEADPTMAPCVVSSLP